MPDPQTRPPRGIAVVDVGSTNTKLLLLGPDLQVLAEEEAPSAHPPGPPYLSIDVEPALALAARVLPAFDRIAPVDVVVPCAHGSAFALLGRDGALALPIMDYNAEPPEEIVRAYAAIEPPFDEVGAPTNPGALTVGRQLLWQETLFRDAFARARAATPLGPYLGWRLCGEPISHAVTEVTALGAQTHLWDVHRRRPSSLVRARGWARLFPPLRSASAPLGRLAPAYRGADFRGDGRVLVGIHDSSANFLRCRAASDAPFTLLSTGTWIIAFAPGAVVAGLDPKRDLVLNAGLDGEPIACGRFKGGEELAIVADGAPAEAADPSALGSVLDAGLQAIPSFTDSGGPIPGTGGKGRVATRAGDPAGPLAPPVRAALAALYCAYMTDASLQALCRGVAAEGVVIVDGPFATNALFLSILAALAPGRVVKAATETQGAALGAALLALIGPHGALPSAPLASKPAAPLEDPRLDAHLTAWRARIGALRGGA